MLKTIKFIVLATLCLNFSSKAQAPIKPPPLKSQAILGKVISAATGEALSGAVIKVNNTNQTVISDAQGAFILTLSNGSYNLSIRYLSHKTKNLSIQLPMKEQLLIALDADDRNLHEVEIVSTGYQQIPKERATGSFEQIDQELFNREVGTNILSRLDGITTGLLVDKRTGGEQINIRGINTFTSSLTGPLVVVDNFPFSGSINSINPNDVENITILKDAAATSIWGARAGNGVIVINLKKGKFNQPFALSFNSNTTIAEKTDLFYFNEMSSSDFIDVEQMLYSKGFYTNDLLVTNKSRPVISPVINLLNKQAKGLILADEALNRINELRSIDYRTDLLKNFYQPALNQQYSINLSGGNAQINYMISGGFDQNQGAIRGMKDSRYTMRSVNTIRPLQNLEIKATVLYTQSKKLTNIGAGTYPINVGGGKGALYPYAQLVGANGEALDVGKDYNMNYTDTAGKGKLLDWKFRPYDEISFSNGIINIQDVNLGISAKYTLLQGVNVEMNYNYGKQSTENKQYRSLESYYTRNLINRFTQINGTTVKRIIPLGGILDLSHNEIKRESLRGQVNLSRVVQEKHEINAIAGLETTNSPTLSDSERTYGYDDEILTYGVVDYVNPYPIYGEQAGNGYVPNQTGFSKALVRLASIYGNASYTFNKRYTISGSTRRDASNVFGVKVNNRWRPLWSTGLSWIASGEPFYKLEWLPYLRLRTTYGHSGNISDGANTRIILRYVGNAAYTNLKYAQITFPPNPEAKWEDVRMINYGVDFATKKNMISGSLEYFTKKSTDLISPNPIDPTTGFSSAQMNIGVIKSKGFDIQLNSRNIDGIFKWNTTASLSYVKDVVAQYYGNLYPTTTYASDNGGSISPIVNHVLYPLFSYRFVGLDSGTGDPIGSLNGISSKAYGSLIVDSLQNLLYNGSAIPLYSGFLMNTISWKQLSLSFNITFKFDYFFRKETIRYYDLYTNWAGHGDFSKRWRQTGDELNTSVPSMVYPANTSRDAFYAGSEANIEKGDHIRLKDIRLNYSFSLFRKKQTRTDNSQFYIYANNIGMLWRANRINLDPDSYGLPPARTLALGLKVAF